MPEPDTIIPVIEETLSIDKQEFVSGRARVETVTDIVEEIVTSDLEFTTVEIDRVAIGMVVEAMPGIRVEGDVTIIPVVEETVVFEKRLVLREEIRITRRRAARTDETRHALRKQRAIVSRERSDAPNPLKSHDEESTMTDLTGNLTGNRHLSAFFDSRADAESAAARLNALGLSGASVQMSGGDDYSTRPDSREPGGLWESISDFFFPTDERETYAEGLRRGGYLVTVSGIPDARFDEVVDILDDAGSVDLDERSESWRAEGWQGSSPDVGGILTPREAGLTDAARAGYETRADEVDPVAASLRRDDLSGSGLAGDLPASGAATDTRDEVIPVVEERLRVGKRDMSLGRVRVRSYVVEEPVSEDVSLRADRVEIERRPVDRALADGDAAFVDRTIEAEERAEEAVVQKEARVVEEIGLRRTSDERTETISDTVRHTEVEVEDDRDVTKRDPAIRGA